MEMRSAAALLLLTLIGPSILGVLCDFRCVHHKHPSSQSASNKTCHEQQGRSDSPVVDAVAGTLCHEQAETFTTTVSESRLLNTAPVAMILPAALVVNHQRLLVPARNTFSDRPGSVPQTTPLRI
jgi:hypothetical protein